MEAGRLRHRVTIQSKTVVQDAYGEETITWGTFATVWANVEPLRGREFLEARQVMAEVSTRITMRYYAGVKPEMRAVFGSITYDILAVIHVESREREMQLMCQEIVE